MAKRINTEIIDNFEKLQENLFSILEAYGYTKTYLITKLEVKKVMSRATFYKKEKELSFTVSDMRAIAEILNK